MLAAWAITPRADEHGRGVARIRGTHNKELEQTGELASIM